MLIKGLERVFTSKPSSETGGPKPAVSESNEVTVVFFSSYFNKIENEKRNTHNDSNKLTMSTYDHN